MRATIIEPWLAERTIVFADKEWEPRKSSLVILEGPQLADTELTLGRGWSNAEKRSENVTRRLLDEAAKEFSIPVVAVLAEGSGGAAVTGVLEDLALPTVSWAELRALILDPARARSGPGYAAVLTVESASPPASWVFDAGLARGALGRRAVFVQLGDAGIPAQLSGVELMRFDAEDEASRLALRDRLTK